MTGVAWDWQSAQRISRAVRQVEGSANLASGLENAPLTGADTNYVKTPSTLPGSYDGTEALSGKVVYRLADGTIHDTGIDVWIKDLNDTPLSADKIYKGTLNGTLDQDSTTQALYLVQESTGSNNGPVSLEYVYPWRWVDVTIAPPLFTVTGTFKALLYQRWEQLLQNMTSSSGYPELADIATPGDPFWLDPSFRSIPSRPDTADIIPCWVDQGSVLPFFSDNNTTLLSETSSTYYEGTTAAAWYLGTRMNLALPKTLGRFTFPPGSSITVAKFGGGTMPIYSNLDVDFTGYWNINCPVIATPMLATVKYKSAYSATWGVTSSPYPWKNSAGTLKDLYFWFWDPAGLLANSGADQQVVVTPVNSVKLNSSFTSYGSSGPPHAGHNNTITYIITLKY